MKISDKTAAMLKQGYIVDPSTNEVITTGLLVPVINCYVSSEAGIMDRLIQFSRTLEDTDWVVFYYDETLMISYLTDDVAKAVDTAKNTLGKVIDIDDGKIYQLPDINQYFTGVLWLKDVIALSNYLKEQRKELVI